MIQARYRRRLCKTEDSLRRMLNMNPETSLRRYGEEGLKALVEATPRNTGKTAESWEYSVNFNDGVYSVVWSNTNVEKGYAKIAILLDVGHGTANGGYVSGRHYINPAMQPIFDNLAAKMWLEVTRIV